MALVPFRVYVSEALNPQPYSYHHPSTFRHTASPVLIVPAWALFLCPLRFCSRNSFCMYVHLCHSVSRTLMLHKEALLFPQRNFFSPHASLQRQPPSCPRSYWTRILCISLLSKISVMALFATLLVSNLTMKRSCFHGILMICYIWIHLYRLALKELHATRSDKPKYRVSLKTFHTWFMQYY